MSKLYIGNGLTEFQTGNRKIILDEAEQEELKGSLVGEQNEIGDLVASLKTEISELKESLRELEETRVESQDKNFVSNGIEILEMFERYNPDLTIKDILKKDERGVQEINICEDRDDLKDFIRINFNEK